MGGTFDGVADDVGRACGGDHHVDTGRRCVTTTDIEIKCKPCETNVLDSSDVPEWSDE